MTEEVFRQDAYVKQCEARVTGVDTTWWLAGTAAERGYRVFLLGAASGVAERAAEVMKEAYPGLTVSGTHAGSPDAAEEESIRRRVLSAKACASASSRSTAMVSSPVRRVGRWPAA